MDATDIILSPLMIERKKKMEKRSLEILNENYLRLKQLEFEYYNNTNVD